MEIPKIGSGFCGLKIGKIPSYAMVYIPTHNKMESLAKSADVFIKLCEKDFPYSVAKIPRIRISALKISARPLKLGFWEKLFNKRTVTDYFPIGNMRNSVIYDKNKTVLDVISDLVAKVK